MIIEMLRHMDLDPFKKVAYIVFSWRSYYNEEAVIELSQLMLHTNKHIYTLCEPARACLCTGPVSP